MKHNLDCDKDDDTCDKRCDCDCHRSTEESAARTAAIEIEHLVFLTYQGENATTANRFALRDHFEAIIAKHCSAPSVADAVRVVERMAADVYDGDALLSAKAVITALRTLAPAQPKETK